MGSGKKILVKKLLVIGTRCLRLADPLLSHA